MNYNSKGLRGSLLEELINMTNDVYNKKKLAIIKKIPTPITPIRINPQNSTITLAYFSGKSTVDYIGVVQGIPICFDAKETAKKTLSLNNIHTHQIDFMKSFEEQEGISFLIVYFKEYEEYFFMPLEDVLKHIKIMEDGGRKSILYTEFKREYLIRSYGKFHIHYLEALNTYLEKKL